VIFILAIALVALAVLFAVSKHSPGGNPDVVVIPPVTNAVPVPTPIPVVTKPIVIPKKVPNEKELQATIAQETERLAQWSMNEDPQSLSNIIGDLASPVKEIRMAAIEATKQFGGTNAVPVLRAMAANTDDHEEAEALLEAAEFLELPDYAFPGAAPAPQ